jgi:hypothetical protein
MEIIMKKNKNLLKEFQTEYNGETITVKKFKIFKNKPSNNGKNKKLLCPNCASFLKADSLGHLKCTGNKLEFWEKEFIRFDKMDNNAKIKYITNISNYSNFMELYDKWKFSVVNNLPEEFNCGFVNDIYPPNGNIQIKIPDPLVVKRLEKKLGRKLTEEELLGESELWAYGGRVLTHWRRKAKQIRIPFIVLPSEETFYL